MSLRAEFNNVHHLGTQKAFAPPPVGTPTAVGELAVQAMRAAAQAPSGTGYVKLAAIGIAGLTAAGYGAYRLWTQTPQASDFPHAQPDPKFSDEIALDLLKQQKTLAELSGNKPLAQLFNVLIAQRGADLIPAQFPGQKFVTGALNMVATAGDGGSDSTTVSSHAMSVEEEVARARMKAANPVIQWRAWQDLYRLNPEAARAVTQADLGPPAPFVAGTQGVAKYVIRGSRDWENAAIEIGNLLDAAHAPSLWQTTTIDIRLLHPSHSLMDFMPGPYSKEWANDPMMDRHFQHLHYLQELHDGSKSAAEVLHLFIRHSVNGEAQDTIEILQFPSGRRIIRNGHHRLAALIKAAREGVIPEDWLQQVPVDLLVVKEDFPIPEAVILQIYAPAHTLTLDELLPPQAPQPK